MRCVCSDGKVHCFGIGVVGELVVIVKDVIAFTLKCTENEEVEEVVVDYKLVIVKNGNGKRVALVYA
jgi:hypothetical protein